MEKIKGYEELLKYNELVEHNAPIPMQGIAIQDFFLARSIKITFLDGYETLILARYNFFVQTICDKSRLKRTAEILFCEYADTPTGKGFSIIRYLPRKQLSIPYETIEKETQKALMHNPQNKNKGCFCFGQCLEEKGFLIYDMEQLRNMFVFGNLGKTTLLRSLILQTYQFSDADIYVIDTIQNALSDFKNINSNRITYIRGTENAERTLQGIANKSKADFKKYGYCRNNQIEKRTVIFIDDFDLLVLNKYRQKEIPPIIENLLCIVNIGYKLGVHIIITANAGNIQQNSLMSIKVSFNTMASFRANKQFYELLLGNDYSNIPRHNGDMFVQLYGNVTPIRVQCPIVTENDINL